MGRIRFDSKQSHVMSTCGCTAAMQDCRRHDPERRMLSSIVGFKEMLPSELRPQVYTWDPCLCFYACKSKHQVENNAMLPQFVRV